MRILFVYSGNGDLNSSIVLNQAGSLEELKIDIGYYPIKDKGIWGYLKHAILIRRHLLKNEYAIIHAHYGLCGIAALFSRRKEKIIVSFMGDDLLGSNSSDGDITLFSNVLLKINRFLAKRFYDFSIVKSEEMAKNLKYCDNVGICPNGVNLEVFYPVERIQALQRTGFSQDRINLIFVSDPSRHEKNYALIQSAIQILEDSRFQLHVIKNIETEELKYYYSAADMLILTSLHEGSPNVIKEAMACNCPIVSTDVGDVKRIMGDTAGCFVSSFDPVDVAEKVKLAVDFVCTNGRTKGRDRIIEIGLDSKDVAKKIVEIYKMLIF
jgi:teichuronic acid biosynthesis glycosyltransferase TuaC